MKKRIILILLIFILSIGFASASENTTDMQTTDNIINDEDVISEESSVSDSPVYYVNNSKETSGDGSNWANASKSISLKDNSTIFLAEGEYEIPGEHINVTYIGMGKDTLITSFSFKQSYYFNTNHVVTVINATFKPYDQYCGILHYGLEYENVHYNVLVDEMDFKFINCTFINSEFLSRTYERTTPNRDTLTDVVSANFENCTFKDFNGNYLVNNWEFSKFEFNKCIFENITSDAIVDSYGGRSDSQGRVDGVYIYNSTFKNCNIKGIVKARQLSYCEIVDCTYDFDASETVDLVSPFYVNKTIKSANLNETQLTVTSKDNSVIITLTDVNTNKPIAGVEVAIINNNKVFAYRDTDSNGQIVLDNLLGTYNFEFSYPGDEYVGYAPTSLNKTLTFNKTKINTIIQAPKVTATYNIAKNLVITLKDANGNVLVGKYVTVKVGTISKNLKTDKNGQVSVNVATLTPKTYTASISFAGDTLYNAKSIKANVVVAKATPKLTAKKATFKAKKTKKYTVTLKDNKGKAINKVKVTIKVKGKTYKATTKKGKATFKLTKLTKKGTYKATIKFAGNSLYKAVTKKSVKIVVKK